MISNDLEEWNNINKENINILKFNKLNFSASFGEFQQISLEYLKNSQEFKKDLKAKVHVKRDQRVTKN